MSVGACGQDLDFQYLFSFEPARVTRGPQLGSLNIKYPDEARKNGIEGTAKVKFTLGEDGKVRDIEIIEDLPHGVGNAVKLALEKLQFTPASYEGEPAAITGTLTYEIRATYSEYDSDVTKVKLVGKPTAEHPASLRSEGRKGEVRVGVAFYPDGKVKVLEAKSTMPKEFDDAASKAAADLKFQPAVHKKSKKPVAQTMWVVFKFEP